jgi:hypothetical protein
MKNVRALVVAMAITLPASAADPKVVVAQACHDAGYDSAAIDHFMALIKAERTKSGTLDTDLLHAWGEQVKCYVALLDKVAAWFKQQTGRKFVVEKVCASGAPREAYANGVAAGSSPGPTCAQ